MCAINRARSIVHDQLCAINCARLFVRDQLCQINCAAINCARSNVRDQLCVINCSRSKVRDQLCAIYCARSTVLEPGLTDDGVEIDLPSREAIERVLKYLKNNDSIVAVLLKNGGPNLVDALHGVIQQTWTNETLPKSWPEGVWCLVYPTLPGALSITRLGSNQVNKKKTNFLH
jgi:hypothetical protein